MRSLVVPARFNGPARSGNGGWTAGSLATALEGAAAVTVRLRRPPPLETSMTVDVTTADGVRTLTASRAGDVVLTATETTTDELTVVPAASADQAAGAAEGFRGLLDHPFPTCFTCGHRRPPGDGLHLAPGPLPDRPDDVACPWVASDDVDVATVWAALDCPGGWAVNLPGRPMVLGTMTAAVERLPSPGEACVVVGRALRAEGRKAFTATTLWGPDGEPLARASAVWLQVDPSAFA